MSLQDVFEYVVGQLVSEGDNDPFVETFLRDLSKSSNLFSNRLLICIGIDLKVYEKAFPTTQQCDSLIKAYRAVINMIPNIDIPETYKNNELEPHLKFALAVKKYGITNCIPEIKVRENASYTRIITFESFYNHVLGKNKGCNPEVTFDLDPNNLVQFYAEFSQYNEHRDINISVLGSSTGWVFATDKRDIQHSLESEDIASILDQIGYYIGNSLPTIWEKNTYVYLEYPAVFNEDMLQPTALLGDWGKLDMSGGISQGNEFFLSYKQEHSWGMTFPVTGKGAGVKERAHFSLDHPPHRHYPFQLGDLKDLRIQLSKADDSVILAEALQRFYTA